MIEFDSSEVEKKLKEFLDKGLTDALAQGLTNAGAIIEKEAKKKCPVDDGQLRQSIGFDVDSEKAQVTIGTNVEYAPYVEIGTGIYSSKGDGRKTPWEYEDEKGEWHRTRGSKPQPFLGPAADESKDEILKSFEGLI